MKVVAGSRKTRTGQRTIHAVIVDSGKLACTGKGFSPDTLHDAYDDRTGSLTARAAIMGSRGCRKCQNVLTGGKQ